MKAGMPRWFENKVFRKSQTYMPSSFGGLGIPSLVDWTQDQKCCNIYKAYCLDHQPGLLKPKQNEKSWHRGQEFQEQLISLGNAMEGKSFQEAWLETRSRLDSGTTTESGSRRIQRQVYKEFVRIDEPCSLTGTKEATPPAFYNGRSDLKTVRPNRRSRQILQQKARLYHNNKVLVDSIPYNQVDMEDLHMKRPGLWVEREVLQEALKIRFSVPRLGFTTRLFDGEVGNFTSDTECSYDELGISARFELYEFDLDQMSV
jgi:hypothetical protein